MMALQRTGTPHKKGLDHGHKDGEKTSACQMRQDGKTHWLMFLKKDFAPGKTCSMFFGYNDVKCNVSNCCVL